MCLAIPGELTEVSERDGMRFGRVCFGGIVREVCLDYQPDARPGDFVLVHVGFAIATVDPDEAARTWALLKEIGQTGEVEDPETVEPEDREVRR